MTRQLIGKYRDMLRDRINYFNKLLSECHKPIGIGYFDREDYDKARIEYEKQYIKLTTNKESLEEAWRIFKSIVGELEINQALQEYEERIGEIPFVK